MNSTDGMLWVQLFRIYDTCMSDWAHCEACFSILIACKYSFNSILNVPLAWPTYFMWQSEHVNWGEASVNLVTFFFPWSLTIFVVFVLSKTVHRYVLLHSQVITLVSFLTQVNKAPSCSCILYSLVNTAVILNIWTLKTKSKTII
jgi:hypothetical protein